MPILEKIPELPQEDLALYEVLRHPVFCGEFIRQLSQTEKELEERPFLWSDYQVDFLSDFGTSVSMCCGRAVGKTEALKAIIYWLLVNNIFPGDYVVYLVPNKAQLEPVWNGLTKDFASSPLLTNFVSSGRGINSGTHTIKLNNSASLLCRIAGTGGTGANVIGLHTPFKIVDEAGVFPWSTYMESLPTHNTWTPGFREMVVGVPTGVREKNVLYHADIDNTLFTKHRIPAIRNPRYTEDDRQRDLQKYGGQDGEDYIHFVLGRHGRPVYSVFDRTLMDISPYTVYKLSIDGIKLQSDIAAYLERIAAFPGLDKKHDTVIMGVDLGYNDPTAIVILYKDRNGRFKFHGRISLNKVPYPIQSKLIDYLDTKLKPDLIGVDEGNVGKAEIQKMHMEPEYKGKNYKKRMIPIDFNSNVILGIDSEGKEIKSRTKPLSVSILQDYSNNKKIVYSSRDLELVTELERMTYVKSPTGNTVYKTLTPLGGQRGSDHFTAALLCAMMAYYLEHESIGNRNQKRYNLFTPKWNRGW